jgi:hypothetical protein
MSIAKVVDLDTCIPFRTVSSSDSTTARLGRVGGYGTESLKFLKTELRNRGNHYEHTDANE